MVLPGARPRQVLRAGSIALAALLLAGCSFMFPLDLVVRGGKLLFWTEREWRWFLIPTRPKHELCSIEVWSGRSWIWRVESTTGQIDCPLAPIAYGEAPPGMRVIVPPHRLHPGIHYDVEVNGSGFASFELTPERHLRRVQSGGPRPDEIARQEQRERRLQQLMKEGRTEQEALLKQAQEDTDALTRRP